MSIVFYYFFIQITIGCIGYIDRLNIRCDNVENSVDV